MGFVHEIYRLSISQRQCRFSHESDVMIASPIYSYNLCHIECRMRMSLKLCNCIPHFYRSTGRSILFISINYIFYRKGFNKNFFSGKNNEKFKICDFAGMSCLAKIKGKIGQNDEDSF